MPLSKEQAEARRLRKQKLTESNSRGFVLVEQNGWYGIFGTDYGDTPELISQDRKVAERALALRRQDDPYWRDVR